MLAATGGKGVDLIVDQVSASVANGNMKAAAVLGRIVNVGRLGGFKGEFDFDLHALKRIDYIGVTFRTRSVEEVREINRRMRADLWGDVEGGKLQLPIDRTFPLERGGGGAGAHEGQPAFRQDRARDLKHGRNAVRTMVTDIVVFNFPACGCLPVCLSVTLGTVQAFAIAAGLQHRGFRR